MRTAFPRYLTILAAGCALAVATPLAASAAPAVSSPSPTTLVSSDAASIESLPAFAGGKLTGTVSETEMIEGFGKVAVTMDYSTGDGSITLPDGTTQTFTGEDLIAGAKAIDESSIDTIQASSVQTYGLTPGQSEQVCAQLTQWLGAGHTALWTAALSLMGVNPLIGVLVALGQGAFFAWVSTNC